MLYILGNRYLRDCQSLECSIPKEVIETVDMVLEVLENNYNCGNMPFVDGGYVALIPDNQKGLYEKFLYQYKLSTNMAEYRDTIMEQDGAVWYQEYYQIATEYGIVVIFCVPGKEEEIKG